MATTAEEEEYYSESDVDDCETDNDKEVMDNLNEPIWMMKEYIDRYKPHMVDYRTCGYRCLCQAYRAAVAEKE